MVKLGLFVRLESIPGKEREIENFLKAAVTMVDSENQTPIWFALRIGPSTFGIFDAFDNESGREAHLAGQVAKALFEKAPELFSTPPTVEKVDIFAAKLS